MKKKILMGLLLAGSTMFAAPRDSFGFSFGAPAVAPVPPCPGTGYEFINGYWQFVGDGRGYDRDDHRDYDRDNGRRDYYRGDDDRRGYYRGDNDRRATEHSEHFDRRDEQFRR